MTVSLVHLPATKLQHSTATSVSGAITQPTAGNVLVAIWSGYTATEGEVSDNQGNSWQMICQQLTPGGDYLLNVHYARNVSTGSPFNVTLDSLDTGHGITGWIVEIEGCDTAYPHEADEERTRNGSSTTPATESLTNSSLDAVVFAGSVLLDSQDPITLTNPGAPWTLIGEELLGFTYNPGSVVYRILSTSTNSDATWGSTDAPWATAIVAFQGAPTLFGPPPGRGPP